MSTRENSAPEISILYVEDGLDARVVLADVIVMRYPAVRLLVAENGAAGLEMFKEHRPDIVVTDINMPVMDGIAMSAEIRLLAPETVIVVLTAFSDSRYLIKAIEIGVSQYVLKPIDNERLFSVIDTSIVQVMAARQVRVQHEHIRKLSIAVEQSPSVVVITDTHGTIEYVNPRFTTLTGFLPEEAIGQNPRILHSGCPSRDSYQNLWKTIMAGNVWHGEFHNRKKNGDAYWESASISPVFDSSGVITHFVAVKEDITERKRLADELRRSHDELEQRVRARTDELSQTVNVLLREVAERTRIEGALRESESLLRTTFDNAPFELWIRDRDGYCIMENATLARHWGSLLGLRPEDVTISGDTLAIWLDNNRRAFAGEEVRGEVEYVEEGVTRVCDNIIAPIRVDGEIRYILGINIDITERKRAERALLQSREELNQAQRVAGAGSWQFDARTGIVTWSDELYRIHGFSPGMPLPTYEEHRRIFTPESLAKMNAAVEKTLSTGEPHKHDLELVRPDGTKRWVTTRGEAVRDQDGAVWMLRGITIDITERKQLELQLAEAKKLEAIGQLAGGVAHEVRNPLNAILSISEALFKEKGVGDNPEFEPYIEHIRAQVNRLAYLMNDLLELGKPIPAASLHPVPFGTVCSDAAKLLELSGVAKGHRVRFVWGEEFDRLRVLADGVKLQQVVTNLLENAIQHTPEGGEVVLKLAFSGSPGMAAIQITDSGSGIPTDRIGRVFEPFYSTRKGGTGLGLALVKHFVEYMGGQVTIWNNDPLPGCTAEVRIPIAGEMQR